MNDDRQDLLCTQCGASLQLPDDPTAKSVRCSFCHHTNLLPERVVREASSREQRDVEGTAVSPKALALVLVAALVVAGGSIGAAVLLGGPSVGLHTTSDDTKAPRPQNSMLAVPVPVSWLIA